MSIQIRYLPDEKRKNVLWEENAIYMLNNKISFVSSGILLMIHSTISL